MTHTYITISSDILNGIPVFAGTQVPVQDLWDYMDAGATIDDFLELHPSITREQAFGALTEAQEFLVDDATHHPKQ